MSDQAARVQPLSRNWSPAAKSGSTLQPAGNMPAPTLHRQSTLTPSKNATTAPRAKGPRQTSLTAWFGSSPGTGSSAAHQAAAPDDLFYSEASYLSSRGDVEPPLKKTRLSRDEDDEWVMPPARDGSPAVPQRQQRTSSSPLKRQTKEKRRGGFIVDTDDSDDSDAEESANGHSGPHEDVLQGTQDDSLFGDGPEADADQKSDAAKIVSKEATDGNYHDLAVAPLMPRPKSGSNDETFGNGDPGGVDSIGLPVALDGTVDPQRPPLMRQDTSLYTPGEFGDEDFEQDEFYEEGEEYLERRWMEEQAEMEAAFDEDSKSESGTESVRTPTNDVELPISLDEDSTASCPICNGTLRGLNETQASSHVNACLDGTAPALPMPSEEPAVAASEGNTKPDPFKQPAKSAHRFQRAAIARPPQANPFNGTKDSKPGGSAFTRLMSGHAEDLAWAEAASNEKDSRGKPSYQRTCPFYKIMPGFCICVDAFRYGKVEGQSAYFLSHFHSDHYIGLTSSWSHGPIYASKVTCNLMRQCLRVDKKYIRVLEFEKKYEVPDTKGVFVTMIPANHCPGSSIYLFEKVTGKNRDGSDRLTRILHCGDFRACPAHVNHPLLRANLIDAVSGATKEQWLDSCYLDTTYLTPKYAFPSQTDVIDACAAMCVSLSNEIADPGDAWEATKAHRMGATMSKFLEAGDTKVIQPETEEAEDSKANLKPRGRLLVVIGTYSIGKERICLGIAKALNSKIYAPPNKMKICHALEDAELNSRLTSNKYDAQVHMQILFEIRAETLHDYLVTMKPHFSRIVGFRPTGWNYKPPTSRFTENPAVDMILHSDTWKSKFLMRDLVPQRGSTKESHCFGVPYSEHSSFRELTMFCSALRIKKVIPTVNVGSARSRDKMKKWIDKWAMEQKKKGLFEWENGQGGSGGDTERFEGLHYGV